MTPAERLREQLQSPWRHGAHVDARGMVLEDKLILDDLDICGFDLSKAHLKGGLSARNARLHGLAWLRGATIDGDCDLTGVQSRSDLRCDGVAAGRVSLDNATLQGVLSLAQARIETLLLRNALVMANFTCESAQITRLADLTGAEVLGGVWTENADIADLALDRAHISGRLNLPRPNARPPRR